MAYNPKPANPEFVYKIEVLDLPTQVEPGEGLYELRYAATPDEWELHDIITMRKKLAQMFGSDHVAEQMLDRLQNFRKLYINLQTGETSS